MTDAKRRIAALLLCVACCQGALPMAGAAEGPREMHGSADIFAAPGVALAWGVLRGATEAATEVVIRIAADPAMFGAVTVVGSDPFTKRERPILPAASTAAAIDVRVPRAHFADFPRTELRLFESPHPAPSGAPSLVVFYLGVPDTAPEFPSATALESYLVARIAQARGCREQTAMTPVELAAILDHSVLKPEATEEDVRSGADVVREWSIGFYCVQPCWVTLAARLLTGTAARVVSVVGFPHGCDRAEAKARAAELAVADGAAEIDMVQNFGALKSRRATIVAADIEAVVRAVPGIPVKVILETAALTEEEKRLACQLAVGAGAAFVKTSTGFHPAGGATVHDVRLMRAAVGASVGVKASGGIRGLADALAMRDAGANRIGTSASAAILAALASP